MPDFLNHADAFLAIANQFRLGELPTEQAHPLTADLSRLAVNDLPAALRILQAVDLLAVEALVEAQPGLENLARAISETLNSDGRIFIAGCGATGRLALTLETFFPGMVVGFMAGGDSALIRSLEGFEDFPDYGARQLHELGFAPCDLLIGVTEGGETPFVIGATAAAQKVAGRRPWFCYCNPDKVLCRVADRSRRVLQNDAIRKLPIITGPMALAGSTRMQATTVQMAAVGLALKHHTRPEGIAADIEAFRTWVGQADYTHLTPLITAETTVYQEGGHVLYRTRNYGMAVLTDTTERAPTFSLPPFENTLQLDSPTSLCYLSLPDYADAASAWHGLLGRGPRCLEWAEIQAIAGYQYLIGFDISVQAGQTRSTRLGSPPEVFDVDGEAQLRLSHGPFSVSYEVPECPLLKNLCLKVLLNAHSTLVMGRLGRYEGNLMTWVKPSNNKLIDRAIRYVRILYEKEHASAIDYASVCHGLFSVRETMKADEPIVLKTLEYLIAENVNHQKGDKLSQ